MQASTLSKCRQPHATIAVQENDSVGELSLLAMRPVWYSLVTTSETAAVLSIDLAAVRDYITACVPPVGVAR